MTVAEVATMLWQLIARAEIEGVSRKSIRAMLSSAAGADDKAFDAAVRETL